MDYIDLSGVYNAINRATSTINSNLQVVDSHVDRVEQNLRAANEEIRYLKSQLVEMARNQKLNAALQRALTEIVRIRQELEQKFGTQKLVRENMLGILQATDLGLITKTTISRCTEELMISAPKYWLAPALVALAAWISDNKSLAKRAVKEAIKRDKEKTYLLFALITRRVNAGRIAAGKQGTNSCFIWLNKYFGMLDCHKMKRSIIAYIDAYTNGVFGDDKDNICRDNINNWIKTLMDENPDFVSEQRAYWLEFFNKKAEVADLTSSVYSEEFRALQKICPEYDRIEPFVTRLSTVVVENAEDGNIKSYFEDIENQQADTEKLVNDIDDQLIRLVSNYEDDEVALRREEERNELIKKYNGSEEAADKIMSAKDLVNAELEQHVDFVERLRSSITNDREPISARKTAFSFMKGYIGEAYNQFLNEYKDDYPEEINFVINDSAKVCHAKPFKWDGKTTDCSNEEELKSSLSNVYDENEKKALSTIVDTHGQEEIKKGKITWLVGLGVALVSILLGIILQVAVNGFWWALAVVGGIAGLIVVIVGLVKSKNGTKELALNTYERSNIKKYFANNKNESLNLLDKALSARRIADNTVLEFNQSSDADQL